MEHLEIACDLLVILSGLAGLVSIAAVLDSMRLTIEMRTEFE